MSRRNSRCCRIRSIMHGIVNLTLMIRWRCSIKFLRKTLRASHLFISSKQFRFQKESISTTIATCQSYDSGPSVASLTFFSCFQQILISSFAGDRSECLLHVLGIGDSLSLFVPLFVAFLSRYLSFPLEEKSVTDVVYHFHFH